MSRSKLIQYAMVPLLAVLAFWWGGYLYFKRSSDWQEIQSLLSADAAILAVVGDVKEVSVSPIPFMYRFSGERNWHQGRAQVNG